MQAVINTIAATRHVFNISIILISFGLVAACSSGSGGSAPANPTGEEEDVSNNAIVPQLSSLAVNAAPLDQVFQGDLQDYTATAPFLADTTQITAVADSPDTIVFINNAEASIGTAIDSVPLAAGETVVVNITLVAADVSGENSYTVAISRQSADEFASQIVVNNAVRDENDLFGQKVALDGDTLVVSAIGEDSDSKGVGDDASNNDAEDSGAVYVFVRDNDVWTQQAYIKPSNTDALDSFGFSVAVDGDTLAVGSRFEASGSGDQDDNAAKDSGAVYIFVREDTEWQQQAYLKASNASAEKGKKQLEFGFSLDLDGDLLAVGAHTERGISRGINGDQTVNKDTSISTGAVYVFSRNAQSEWSQEAYIKASNADPKDLFGFRVALDNNTLVAGAMREDSSGTDQADNSLENSGAAYVFVRENGEWRQQAYLKASNAVAGDEFGYRVALDQDIIAITAHAKDNATGSVYVFERNGEIWSETAILRGSNSEQEDYFGDKLDVSGNRIAVGANSEDSIGIGMNADQLDNSDPDAGAVYMFMRDAAGVWTQEFYLKSPDADSKHFSAVKLDGNTLAVGAWGDTSTGTGGEIYVFE